MRVLVACEFSGIVRDAFLALNHDAVSCDLLQTEMQGPHIRGDVKEVLHDGWDLMIAHPPCTFLCNSGVRWLYNGSKKDSHRWAGLETAAKFFNILLTAPIPMIAVENPIMHSYGRFRVDRNHDQIIHPWQFGHEETKSTCLWLSGLDQLRPTDIVGPPPSKRADRKSWEKCHRASRSLNRWKDRSRTMKGIASAMAEQWGTMQVV